MKERFDDLIKEAFFGNEKSQDMLIELSDIVNKRTTKIAEIKNDEIRNFLKLAGYSVDCGTEFFKIAKEALKGITLTKESFVFPEADLNAGVDASTNALIGGATLGAAGNVLTKDEDNMKKRNENTLKGLLLGAGLGGLGTVALRESV